MPFVLLLDVFPFMRQAMFARPYQEFAKTESFWIQAQATKTQYVVNAAQCGLNETHFLYLIRNHHYRDNVPTLLQALATTMPDSVQSLSMVQIVDSSSDTVLLYRHEIKP